MSAQTGYTTHTLTNTGNLRRDPLPAALKIAGKGKPVFPLQPGGKKPAIPKREGGRGYLDATTDTTKIAEWWTRWPDANVGIPTGDPSGLFVVDLDAYKPGAMSLEEFEAKYGPLPETATVRTGNGGLQLYFQYPAGEPVKGSAGKLGPCVDTRGEGNYVIAPPSVTTGRYEWINRAPPAPVPPKLLKALRSKPRSSESTGCTRPAASIPDDGEPITEGGRNQTLTSIAGRLHDGSRDEAQLTADLQAVNESQCIPPLPAHEIFSIARSIAGREPCRPARREPDAETVEALARAERNILAREWKGKGGKTRYSISVALLKLARKHGELVQDGVRVSVSARQLASAAATSRSSIVRNLKVMGDVLRPDNEGIEDGKSGAIVVLSPPAPTEPTLTTELVSRGGCVSSRAPLTAPRLRWSSPAYKPRRGVTPGTSRVRQGVAPEKVAAVIRLGKSCEMAMDAVEAAGGFMELSDLADAVDMERPRDLTRRKNLETGKGRDGVVTRLQDVGVLTVDGNTVSLCEDWLEALDQERERAGEIALFRRDLARYNREREAFRNRHRVKADPAPSEDEMREVRESFPARRREGIETAIARLFREHPEYRGLRAGQITCRLMFFLPEDFPRGSDGAPKDHEVEAILDGVAA